MGLGCGTKLQGSTDPSGQSRGTITGWGCLENSWFSLWFEWIQSIQVSFQLKSNAFFVVAVQILIQNAGGHLETSSDQGIAVSLEPAKISEESEALHFFPLRLQQVGFRINKLGSRAGCDCVWAFTKNWRGWVVWDGCNAPINAPDIPLVPLDSWVTAAVHVATKWAVETNMVTTRTELTWTRYANGQTSQLHQFFFLCFFLSFANFKWSLICINLLVPRDLALENAAKISALRIRYSRNGASTPRSNGVYEAKREALAQTAGIFVFICPWPQPIDRKWALYKILWGSLALDSPSSSLCSFLGSKEAIPFYTKTDLVDPMTWRSCFLCFVAVYGHLEPEQMLMLYFNQHFVFDLMDSDAFRVSGWNWVFSVQEMDVLLAGQTQRVRLLAEPRIHLAFAGQDASGYPSGMTVSWFTRLAGTRRICRAFSPTEIM